MTALLTAPAAFTTATIDYVALLPLFVVFGGALLGVLVAAFVPRSSRFQAQVALTVVVLVAALVAVAVGAVHPRGVTAGTAGAAGIRPGPPTPFVVRPITYDAAFGGADTWHPAPAQHRWFETNPVGKGFHHHLDARYVDGSPMPNTDPSFRAALATPACRVRPNRRAQFSTRAEWRMSVPATFTLIGAINRQWT